MKIAICDDNTEYIDSIKNEIEKLDIINGEFFVYTSGNQLLDAYNSNEWFDVILLDMEMEGLNGIETANRIRNIDEHVIIIFITNHSEYMKESFVCMPFRFLEKPVGNDELRKVFGDVVKKLSKERKTVVISVKKSFVRIFCDDIIWCESRNHRVFIYTRNNTYIIYKSLGDLYKVLDKSLLYRVHKSFIVNFAYIDSIRENEIVLNNSGRVIPISRPYREKVNKDYINYVERDLCL